MRKVMMVLLTLATVTLGGCDAMKGLADFQVSASNRTDHTLMFYANGVEQGEVLAGRARAFVIKMPATDNGVSSATPTTQATFAARDVVTGKLSQEKRAYLSRDRPENIEFSPRDFQ